MNKQLEELKIKQAVLKAVRKISGASFNKKLGDEYGICMTLTEEIEIISMYATKNGEHIECFSYWMGGKSTGWQTPFPKKIIDIPDFEKKVEQALAEIFEYIKGDK